MKYLTLDLHGKSLVQARKEVLDILKKCPADTVSIEIIHGFHNGDVIQKYIRRDLKHKRIERKSIGLNNGSTTLILKSPELK